MLRIRNYRMGVDSLGLLLYVAVLLPNLVWLLLPPPFDVLERVSGGAGIDAAANVLRVLLFLSVCLVVNRGRTGPFKTKQFFMVLQVLLLYFIGWSFYYAGFINLVTVMILYLAPCAAFLLFAAARENIFALITAALFSICHFAQFLLLEL